MALRTQRNADTTLATFGVKDDSNTGLSSSTADTAALMGGGVEGVVVNATTVAIKPAGTAHATYSASNFAQNVTKVALTALDTGGGVLSWANPIAATILITRVVLDVTTKATGACTVDVGVASGATTSNDTLMDGLDVGTAAGVFDNIENQGTNGVATKKMTSSQYVTASMASGAAAGIVGSAYIYWHRA